MPRVMVGMSGLFVLAAAGYLVLCVLLYFTQEASIFFPRPNDPQLRSRFEGQRVEITNGSVTLEGWWTQNPGATTPLVILYFGGNAEDLLQTATEASKLNVRRMLFVNYRGYGRSAGQPGQAELYEDALVIYEYALKQQIAPENVVVMGRSLGSGVAAMLASVRPVRAAILITPFDSLASVGAGHYPYMPVRLLLKHPFPSVDWAQRAQAPALFIAAERDFVIPPTHAHRLFESWAAEKQFHVLPDVGHNDIALAPGYYELINEFLASSDARI